AAHRRGDRRQLRRGTEPGAAAARRVRAADPADGAQSAAIGRRADAQQPLPVALAGGVRALDAAAVLDRPEARVKAPLLALLPVLCLPQAPDPATAFAAGTEAYGGGRFEAALAAFAGAAATLGESAPAELHFDLALAALRAGRPEQ